MSEINGSARARGIVVEVFPGGALSSISLTEPALELGARTLATAVLETVAEATAVANQRTKSALREALVGLGERDLEVLGLSQEAALTERAEGTTPDTWRTP